MGAEEKAEVAVEVKEKRNNNSSGVSSFSQNLEEGEIDEPYVPEYVDEGVHN